MHIGEPEGPARQDVRRIQAALTRCRDMQAVAKQLGVALGYVRMVRNKTWGTCDQGCSHFGELESGVCRRCKVTNLKAVQEAMGWHWAAT